MDTRELRRCGKAKCFFDCKDENQGQPKMYYGEPSVWRQEKCLSCLLKVHYLEIISGSNDIFRKNAQVNSIFECIMALLVRA